MINLDDDHILFIEPKGPKSDEPVNDHVTERMTQILAEARAESEFLGVHECACKCACTNVDIEFPNGQITHGMALHYLQYHRDEVPESEIAKIMNFPVGLGLRFPWDWH